ncbi:MAG TPA: MEDS domain-containing protein [Candidatus Xenobia bacterium]
MANTVTVAHQSVPVPFHACALFRDEEEQYRVLLPFVHEGFERGDRSIHITDRSRHDAHRQRLNTALAEPAEDQGRFLLRAWQELYLQDGCFEQDRMLANVEQMMQEGVREGYAVSRVWADMGWAQESFPGVEDLVEYECRANLILDNYNGCVVCTYDLRRFSAALVVDIIRVHPMVIVGGMLQVNPFYTPPEEMLEELRRRHTP